MELEVGMYVRTDDGYIFKIKEILEKDKYNDSDNKIVQRFRIDRMYQKNDDYIETDYMYSDWIIKASHNIIDLIEIGDYVNGRKVVGWCPNKIIINEPTLDFNAIMIENTYLEVDDIKSIVTKEVFENVSYKVGD